MANKSFVISTVTALALGYTAGFATDGFTARAGVAQLKNERPVIKAVAATPQATIESALLARLKSRVDAKHSDGTLAANWPMAGNRVCIDWYDGKRTEEGDTELLMRIRGMRVGVAGQWTRGAPE